MKKVKKIWNIVSTTLVIFIVAGALFLMGSRLLGYQCYTVLSGSMEPTYHVGSLIYVKTVDVNDIKVGDPITFVLDESLAVGTHRVVRIDKANQRFYTKGDAVKDEDKAPVHFKNVIGVPQFSIPLLGYVSNFVQTSPGKYITIVAGIILVLATFLPDFFKKKPEESPERAALQAESDAAAEERRKLREELERLKSESDQNQN
jgi:signal peptidase